MYGEFNNEAMEWLQRHVISQTSKPLNFSLVADRLVNGWQCIQSIREIGAYKVLITFDFKESIEEAMSTGMELLLK